MRFSYRSWRSLVGIVVVFGAAAAMAAKTAFFTCLFARAFLIFIVLNRRIKLRLCWGRRKTTTFLKFLSQIFVELLSVWVKKTYNKILVFDGRKKAYRVFATLNIRKHAASSVAKKTSGAMCASVDPLNDRTPRESSGKILIEIVDGR